MTALENQFPPLAQALGRLRQPRGWPYATRPAEPATPETALAANTTATPALPDHDFLRMLPEPALTGDLPTNKPTAARETLTAVEAIALAPLNRTYWFDL